MSSAPSEGSPEPIRDRLRRLRREPPLKKAVEPRYPPADEVHEGARAPHTLLARVLDTGASASATAPWAATTPAELPPAPLLGAVLPYAVLPRAELPRAELPAADSPLAALPAPDSPPADSPPAEKPPAEIPPAEIPQRHEVFSRLGRRASAAARGEVPAPIPIATTPIAAGDVARVTPPNSIVRELSYDPPRSLARGERGAWARVERLERSYRHGSFALEDMLDASRERIAERARDERLLAIDLERAVFLDTETTGLSGGAGTYVFLVGLGRFVDGRFELWQGFLPHPADEKTLLQETAARIFDASVIISFFGKSFDRHRLEDKMRLHGVAPPFEARVHLDLYHPLRRAHRGQFENCRLKTLERELVAVMRGDDLPGSFAPAAWFDFLGKRPHRLEGVFRHNREDVLSLVSLAAHLAL